MRESQAASGTLTFGNFRLDSERGCLLSDEVEVPLRPKTFALLSYLVGNPGRLVSKDELIRAVWRGGIVTDDVLVQSVGELRRALGKEGAAFIRTVPRRGYRFEATVAAPAPRPSSNAELPVADGDVNPDAVASPPVNRRRWPLYAAASVLLAMLSAIVAWKLPAQRDQLPHIRPVIAVLPFNAASGTPDQQEFADRLTNDVIAALSRFPLTVKPWRDVQPYRDYTGDSRKLAAGLGVQYYVEAAVLQAGERVTVNAQLVNSQGELLPPLEFSELPADEPVLRNRLSGQIAAALHLRVSQSERRLAAAQSPEAVKAAEFVQRALRMQTYPETEGSGDPIADARKLLREATVLDPVNALARSLLAETYLMTVVKGTEHPEHYLERAREEAELAQTLDDRDIRARMVLGHVYLFEARYEEARKAIDRVLDINPYDPEGWAVRGHILVYLGETDAAIEALEKARTIPSRHDGLGGWDNYALSLAYYLKGRYEDAIATSDAPELDNLPPDWSAALDPDGVWVPAALLAASHAQLDHTELARKFANVARRAPDFASRMAAYPGKLRRQEDQAHLRNGLIKAELLPHAP